jgi:hypothetical protein
MSRRSSVPASRARTHALAAAALLAAGLIAGTASARADTFGHTTPEQRVVPTAGAGFRKLGLGPGEPCLMR